MPGDLPPTLAPLHFSSADAINDSLEEVGRDGRSTLGRTSVPSSPLKDRSMVNSSGNLSSIWRRKGGSKHSLDRNTQMTAGTIPRQVRDPGMAMDFEKLLLSTETKKLTITPDQMKSIEVNKNRAKLEAKAAVVENDPGLLNLVRGKSELDTDDDSSSIDAYIAIGANKNKEKESHWAEFLRTTTPDDLKPGARPAARTSTTSVLPPSPPRSSSETNVRASLGDLRSQNRMQPIIEQSQSSNGLRARALSAQQISPGTSLGTSLGIYGTLTSQYGKANSDGALGEDIYAVSFTAKQGFLDEAVHRDSDAHRERTQITDKSSRPSLQTVDLPSPTRGVMSAVDSPSRPSLTSRDELMDSDDEDELPLSSRRKSSSHVPRSDSLAEFLRSTEPPYLRTASNNAQKEKSKDKDKDKDQKKKMKSALRLFSLGSKSKSGSNMTLGPQTPLGSFYSLGSSNALMDGFASGAQQPAQPAPQTGGRKPPKYTMIKIPYDTTGHINPPSASSEYIHTRHSSTVGDMRSRKSDASGMDSLGSLDSDRRTSSHPSMYDGKEFDPYAKGDLPPVPQVPEKYASATRNSSKKNGSSVRSPSRASIQSVSTTMSTTGHLEGLVTTIMVDRAVETEGNERERIEDVSHGHDATNQVKMPANGELDITSDVPIEERDQAKSPTSNGLERAGKTMSFEQALRDLADLIPGRTPISAIHADHQHVVSDSPPPVATTTEDAIPDQGIKHDAPQKQESTKAVSPEEIPLPESLVSSPEQKRRAYSDVSSQTIHDVLVAETIYLPYPENPFPEVPVHGEFVEGLKCEDCWSQQRQEVEGWCRGLVDGIVDDICGESVTAKMEREKGEREVQLELRVAELEKRLEMFASVARDAILSVSMKNRELEGEVKELKRRFGVAG
ncbi:hypothetical protein BC832DRAFT_591764 [Gaertneriomyces semiglobifer]|nr:hypothetical protein BC832DRAFT_591764 [Gaertneriomyces semiglobifer]